MPFGVHLARELYGLGSWKGLRRLARPARMLRLLFISVQLAVISGSRDSGLGTGRLASAVFYCLLELLKHRFDYWF